MIGNRSKSPEQNASHGGLVPLAPLWSPRDVTLAGLALLALLFAAQYLSRGILPLPPVSSICLVPIALTAVLGGRRSGLLVTLVAAGLVAIVGAAEPAPEAATPIVEAGYRAGALGLIGMLASLAGGALHRRLLALQAASLDRRQAEAQLRRHEAARSFLLGVQDALRKPDDPAAALSGALRMLMDRVGASAAGFAEYDPRTGIATVDAGRVVGMPGLEGQHRPEAFGTHAISRLDEGRCVVHHDIAGSAELAPSEKAAYARLAVAAIILVPEVDTGRLERVLFVASATPRRWTDEEVQLIEDAASRLSAEVRGLQAETLARAHLGALQESRDRMARAEEAARVSTWTFDLASQEFSWPRGSFSLLGEALGERLQHWSGWRDLVHPDDLGRVQAGFQEAVRRRGMLDVRFRVRLPEGSQRWLQTRADVITDERGEPVQLIGLTMDITDQERLRAASASKSAFLANMSHEIRTPLSIIVGLTERLRRRAHDAHEARLLDQLRETSEHLLQVINDILDLAKIEADQLVLDSEPFAVGDVLERTRRLFEDAAARKQLALTVEASAALRALVVRGDALRLSQVLINLCSNAIKFTSTGRIAIGAQSLPAREGHARLRFSVTDTGIGIEAHLREHLFEPFFQGDDSPSRRAGGTGLGLAICKRIADRMGALIEVESEPGHGSTFRIEVELPAVEAAPAALQATPAAVEAQAPSSPGPARPAYPGRRVLLVEDHPLGQEILTEMLEEMGCDVVLAGDGIEAVDLASIGHFDLILMDLQLPALDGYGATRLIRLLPAHHDTPIVALSANAFREDRERALEAGMNEHLAKPITRAELAALFERHLGPAARDAGAPAPADPALLAAVSRLPGVAAPAAWRGSQRSLWDFGQLLRHLLESLGDDVAQMRGQIRRGEREAARALAHRAAGAASLAGATGIAAALVTLERALATTTNPDADAGLLGDVERRMRELEMALETLPEPAAPGTP